MANPKVSVLMTTYNRPQFVGQSIQSVIDQTLKDWELVISDDSENNATEKVVEPFADKDKRIHYFHRLKKGSIANSSNFALGKATGEYVAILDDDDWWMDPKKLEKQIAFLDTHRDYIGCGGGFVSINKDGKETGKILKQRDDAAIRRVALYANPMANSTTMFRRVEAGFYDESLPQFADWDFWLHAGKIGKLYNFPDYFLAYRMWHEGASFLYQKTNVNAAFVIIRRYKHDYPGFTKAYILTAMYWIYARFPAFIRNGMNEFLSRLKKALFSGSRT